MRKILSEGGISYQQISEPERLKLLINGLEVTELDYSAMHPNILYAIAGKQAPKIFTVLC